MIQLATNKKARLNYDISTIYTVGICLLGHETKACKMDHCSITEGIIRLDDKKGILNIYNMTIPLYSKTNPHIAPSYTPKRVRQLLCNKKEMAKIASYIKRGYHLVPMQLIENKHRRIQLELGVGTIYKKREKKSILKDKDISRQMAREVKDLRS